MVFSRKISRAKWEKALEACNNMPDISSFPADTLTSDMRTSGNTLSVWDVENQEDAVLAMMTNNNSRIERVDILYLDDLRGVNIKSSKGNTAVADLIERHKDIEQLNYDSLGIVAGIFLDAYRRQSFRSFTKKEIKNILQKAIDNGRITIDKLNPDVRKIVLEN